jgi:hypothetical protein
MKGYQIFEWVATIWIGLIMLAACIMFGWPHLVDDLRFFRWLRGEKTPKGPEKSSRPDAIK